MDGWMVGWMEEKNMMKKYGWLDGQKKYIKWMVGIKKMEKKMDGWMDEKKMVGWIKKWKTIDGWMDIKK